MQIKRIILLAVALVFAAGAGCASTLSRGPGVGLDPAKNGPNIDKGDDGTPPDGGGVHRQ